jgi:hypothetical protein
MGDKKSDNKLKKRRKMGLVRSGAAEDGFRMEPLKGAKVLNHQGWKLFSKA